MRGGRRLRGALVCAGTTRASGGAFMPTVSRRWDRRGVAMSVMADGVAARRSGARAPGRSRRKLRSDICPGWTTPGGRDAVDRDAYVRHLRDWIQSSA